MTQSAYRAQLLTFNGDPAQSSNAAVFNEDGLLIVEDGHVVAACAYAALASQLFRRSTEETKLLVQVVGPVGSRGFGCTHRRSPSI